MPENLENSAVDRTGKGQFSFKSQTKAMLKNTQTNFHTIALISHAGKVMVKILQAKLQ